MKLAAMGVLAQYLGLGLVKQKRGCPAQLLKNERRVS